MADGYIKGSLDLQCSYREVIRRLQAPSAVSEHRSPVSVLGWGPCKACGPGVGCWQGPNGYVDSCLLPYMDEGQVALTQADLVWVAGQATLTVAASPQL